MFLFIPQSVCHQSVEINIQRTALITVQELQWELLFSHNNPEENAMEAK